MHFRTTIELGGKTATGLVVPGDVVTALGGGRRPPVRVTVGGHTYRTTVATMRGRFLVPLSAANREAAGVAAGDEVEVAIELDSAPREVDVPDDLAAALAGEPAARQFFDGLSFTPSQGVGALGDRGQAGRDTDPARRPDRGGADGRAFHALTGPGPGEVRASRRSRRDGRSRA